MLDAIGVIFVKNAKNAIFDAYVTFHMSYTNMAIWVSKDASVQKEKTVKVWTSVSTIGRWVTSQPYFLSFSKKVWTKNVEVGRSDTDIHYPYL